MLEYWYRVGQKSKPLLQTLTVSQQIVQKYVNKARFARFECDTQYYTLGV